MKIKNLVLVLVVLAMNCEKINLLKSLTVKNKHNGKSWTADDVFVDQGVKELAIAAAKGDIDKIHELAKKGVDVNYRGKEGITPLLWPLYAENKEGFEELLKLGANPNIATDNESGAMEIMRYASGDDNVDYLKIVLKYGGNPNFLTSAGWPLIHNVCDPGPMERLEMVVAAGADLNSRDANGKTPIMYCIVQGQYTKAFYLLEKGAKYSNDIINSQGINFKKYVEQYYYPRIPEQYEARKKVVAFLRKRGIVINDKDPRNQ